ncbi:MAG TPA: sulfur carrier protein ThiS [Sulfitobacter litoralis]|jgi:sulfur carrier protein|uniref:Sulfur carrier protein ThiS n=1 Tax=Sulfitobacter litoralis TaxID=335975 RepID=A0A7V1FPY8_9RHOB|nr:sulfur carrier protein ThiS [Sulfitobacter litoralis]MBQ0717799.1 sulfur carrier protein ThiS [Sulfitobacter litoralis]MBQ0802503.1 sulfur carrier protein ThiS [Sulfitobacter litoralis]HDY95708.1 sulfur carrier protein ThiS [Sulfitobacter litoralis]HDZ54032.1 sulfur carrier protein ThiS [Sulfitobacter litoralis]|tara:strand:+ start:2155 stop:2352 length:198 start_codon:yes stop_codon:yes gene_type:complete
MKIIVNGETLETGAPTLVALLDELGKGDAKVATSVNEAFVPKHQRVDHSLQDGDRVEIVAPRQGG